MQGKKKTKELLYRQPDEFKKKKTLDGDLSRKSKTMSSRVVRIIENIILSDNELM